MQLARLFRHTTTAAVQCRAKPPPRIYTAEELNRNKWLLPDENFEVDREMTG